MAVMLSRLPKQVRDRVEKAAGHLPPPKKNRRVATDASTWACETATCGETFTQWAKAERHAHTRGHYRISAGGLSGIVTGGCAAPR